MVRRFGILKVIVTDNDTQFTRNLFKSSRKHTRIHLVKGISPKVVIAPKVDNTKIMALVVVLVCLVPIITTTEVANQGNESPKKVSCEEIHCSDFDTSQITSKDHASDLVPKVVWGEDRVLGETLLFNLG